MQIEAFDEAAGRDLDDMTDDDEEPPPSSCGHPTEASFYESPTFSEDHIDGH
jgi:hypothetical protein